MSVVLGMGALLLASAAVVVAGFYALTVAAGALSRKRAPSTTPGRIAVLVPAHDEEAMIGATVTALLTELRGGDRLLVVADNCSDRTAARAAEAGALVVERHDPARRGKGYALQFGLDALRDDPPEIVCVVDADCRLDRGALVAVAGVAAKTGRPAQALYLMRAPAGAPPALSVAEFAWILMNRIRSAGLYALFDAARLTGSGMAFPFSLLAARNLASGEIVEDLVLALDLAEAGAAPVHCADAIVRSEFPETEEAAMRQRARWEHGSLKVASRRAPGLLARGLLRGDMRLAALAADALIPPLVIFAAMLAAILLIALAAAMSGAPSALPPASLALALFLAATALGWAVHGRKSLPARDLPRLARYAFGKLRVYGRDARASAKTWTRTDRGGTPP